jgi:pimeloyl-ACP methyl ester carboxylesterase
MLRVAAQADTGLDIASVIAVSPVLDPGATLAALEHGFRPYHKYFVRKWLRSLFKKQAAWPEHYDFTELSAQSGPATADDTDGRSLHRFRKPRGLFEWLRHYRLAAAHLKVPATLITALDDPIIPVAGLLRSRGRRHWGRS